MDRDRFSQALRLLSPTCRYRFRGTTVAGAKNIMAMYRSNSAQGRRLLDEVRFESKIAGFKAGFVGIDYTDHLRKGRHSHVHRCRQYVRVRNERIVAIRHSGLRGEARALKSFYRVSGVRWK